MGGLGWGGLAQLRNYRPTFDHRLIINTYCGGVCVFIMNIAYFVGCYSATVCVSVCVCVCVCVCLCVHSQNI